MHFERKKTSFTPENELHSKLPSNFERRSNMQTSEKRPPRPLEPPDQVEMIRQIIQFDLTRKQVKDLLEKASEEEGGINTDEPVSRPLMQLAKVIRAKELPDPQSLASYLVSQEQNAKLARARLQTLRELLDQTEQCLTG